MAAFPTLGVNIAHPFGTSDAVILRDYAELLQQGMTHLRLGAPPFNYSQMDYVFHVIGLAKSLGINVTWGATCPQSYQATGQWQSFLNLLPALAQRAYDAGVDTFFAGNEEDHHTDPAGPSKSQVRSDLFNVWATITSQIPALHCTYSLSNGEASYWLGAGMGSLDSISLNLYNSLNAFNKQVLTFVATFGGANFNLSEFNYSTGFVTPPATGILPADVDAQFQNSVTLIENLGIRSAYLYAFDYDTFNNNQWCVRQPDGNYKLAYRQLTGGRGRYAE